MSNQNRLILQDFMESLLKRSGALVEPTGYGMLETVLPDELAEQFKDDHLLLAFDYEVAEENPGSKFVTYGSSFLDTATDLALGYGHYTSLFRPQIGVTPPRNLEQQIMDGLEFLRCRQPRVIHQWMVDQVFFEFNFRCIFRSYEKTEALAPVVIDSYNGLAKPSFLELWKYVAPVTEPDYRLPKADMLSLSQLHQQACRQVEMLVRKLAEPVCRSAAALKEKEVSKISSYYEQSAREIEIKISATDDVLKRERLEKQLAATLRDRQLREEDAAARYAVEVEVRLDHLVAYHLPCVHIKLEVQHKNELYNQIVVYNPYSNEIEAPACPVCGEPARRLTPGGAGRLICSSCFVS